MKTSRFFSQGALGALIAITAVLAPQLLLSPSIAYATPPGGGTISLSSATIQNTTATTVDMVITGSNFDRFADSGNSNADSVDLGHIHYNGNVPISASTEGSTITATFPVAVGTFKSGGSVTIAAGTLANQYSAHNTTLLSVSNANITDVAKPVVIISDIDGSYFDAMSASSQTVQLTFSEPVTMPTVSVSPDGGMQSVNDCGDSIGATWCFDYSIPRTNATQMITISNAQDLAVSPNTMNSDSNHTFTVTPYRDSLYVVATMVNADSNQIELIVPSTGPTLSAFRDSGTVNADSSDLSQISYNGVNPTSAVIDTVHNELDLYFPILISNPENGISNSDITTVPLGDLDIGQSTLYDTDMGYNYEDYIPVGQITDNAAPILITGRGQEGPGNTTSQVRLSLSEPVQDVDYGLNPHPNFSVVNQVLNQTIGLIGGDIGEGADNHVDINLDTNDAANYDGPLVFSYDTNIAATQIVDPSGNYMGSVTNFPINAANPGYGGDGSSGNPYQIKTCADFVNINTHLSSDFVLTQDLSCEGSGNSIQVATGMDTFSGTLDGQGHTISVAIEVNGNYIGLFGNLSGTVKNLRIAGTVQGHGVMGALAGITNGATIQYVGSTATVTSDGVQTGGLVGNSNNTTISDSYNTGDVNSSSSEVGGLVGIQVGTTITNSYASGTISGTTNVGGLLGASYFSGNGAIINSFAAAPMTGGSNTGSLVGESNGMTLANDYYDATRSSIGSVCAGDASGACTAENVSGDASAYFQNNSIHSPLNQWNFIGVWQTADGYPTLRSGQSTSQPNQVTGLTATTTSYSEIDLSWTAPADNGNGITGYKIERESPDGGGFSDLVSNTGSTATTYSDTGLSPSTQYNYRVSAINEIGTGVASATADATTSANNTTVSISSCADFEQINNNLAGTYTLAQDLSCAGEGNGIMVATSNPFTGTFDGNGHTISIALNDSQGNYNDVGLFQRMSHATVSNLNITGTIEGVSEMGALAGYIEYTHLSHVSANVAVTVDANSSGWAFGALVGSISNTSLVEDSSASGSINSSGQTVFLGGLAGIIDNSQVLRSYSTVSVTTTSLNLGCGVGGFVGCILDGSDVEQSFAQGSVSADNSAGGFAGGIGQSGIFNCYATGSVRGDSQIGGFSGWLYQTEISNAYAAGSVTGDDGASNPYGAEGGFAGSAEDDLIGNSFSTGRVSHVVFPYAGFIGSDQGGVYYAGNYYDQNTSGQTSCTPNGDTSDCVGVDTAGSPDANYFKGNQTNPPFLNQWDFSTPIWDTAVGFYPTLHAISFDQHLGFIGSGTALDPYQITSCEQLQNMSSARTAHFILENDIDCSATSGWNSNPDEWIDGIVGGTLIPDDYSAVTHTNIVVENNGYSGFAPIGATGDPFSGTLNGNGKTISHLWIFRKGSDYNGIFGKTSGATLSNIRIADSNIVGGGDTGSLVGYVDGGTISNVSLSNNMVRTYLSYDGGGLAGHVANGATISNIGNVGGTVHGSGDIIGGLIGLLNASTVDTASSSADVDGGWEIGGLFGEIGNNSTVTNSFASGGTVTDNRSEYVAMKTGYDAGGFVGYMYGSTVSGSYSTDTVNTTGDYGGGFAGAIWVSGVDTSYATGAVNGLEETVNGSTYDPSTLGGFAGQIGFTQVSQTFATGNVTTTGSYAGGYVGQVYASAISDSYAVGSVSAAANAGGFAGVTDGNYDIEHVYSVGAVTSTDTSSAGGLIGSSDGQGTIVSSFYDNQASNQSVTAGGTGKSTAEMKSSGTFTNAAWDFQATWGIDGAFNSGYPALQFFHVPAGNVAPFAGGRGTSGSPYQITTCTQLQNIGSYLASNFILENDIDCQATHITDSSDPGYDANLSNGGAGFAHIGTMDQRFSGTFNGNNHVIKNLFINSTGDDNGVGLFGVVDTGGVIENVGLLYAHVSGSSRTGALVGQNYGTIHDAFVRGTVSVESGFAGLLVGVNRGPISDSYAVGKVNDPSGSYTGGLAGFSASSITDSFADVSVTGNSYSGGLVGRLFAGSSLTNVFATGSVSGGSDSSSGSIAGENDSATITKAYASTVLSGKSSCFPNGDNTGCTDESSRDYFYASSNEPMASFTDFGTHWQDNGTAVPSLSWELPEITSFTPSIGATDVATSGTLSVVFDRIVFTQLSGSVRIIDMSTGSTTATYDASHVQGGGTKTLVIPGDGNFSLENNKTYGIEIDPSLFKDGNGNDFYGITAPWVWTFTTAAGNGGGGGGGGSGTTGYAKITVTDLSGNPITNASVTVACPSWESFNTFGTTDTNGVVEANPCGGTSWPISIKADASGYYTGESDWQNYDASVDPENEIGGSMTNQYHLSLIPVFNGTGSGTAQDPYIISSCAQLEGITGDLAAHYKIGTESGTVIDCSGIDFQPIGVNQSFTGVLDGNNATVENVTINKPYDGRVGLFSSLYSGSQISNLHLSGGSVTGAYYVGSLAGYIDAGGSLQNISSDFTISATNDYDEGGIAGYAGIYNGGVNTFSYLTYTGSMDINEGDIGGIFGGVGVGANNTSMVIDHATVSDGVIGSYSSGSSNDVGGIVGYLYVDGSSDGTPTGLTISNSIVASPVSTDGGGNAGGLIGTANIRSSSGGNYISITGSSVTNTVSGGYAVGGLIGSAEVDDNGAPATIDIDNSFVTGDITASQGEVGGFVGHAFLFNYHPMLMRFRISNSHATGNVTGDYNVGGLIGGTDGQGPGILMTDSGSTGGFILENDYSTGNVTGNIGNDNAQNAGGLVGYLWCSAVNEQSPFGCSISSSYATGNVTGYENVGGAIGKMEGDTSLQDVYAHGNVSAVDTAGGLVGIAQSDAVGLSIVNTYASGTITNVDSGTNQDFGGLIGVLSNSGDSTISFKDSFSAANLSAVSNFGNTGWLIGAIGTSVPSRLWYATLSNSAELGCAGNSGDTSYCTRQTSGSFFQNSSTAGPLARWDFASAPVWASHIGDYPTLTGNLYVPSTPVVSITTPGSGDTVTSWAPVVDWGNATTCSYSYGENPINHAVSCSANGANIPAPEPSDVYNTNQITLNIQGSNTGGTSSVVSTTFIYTPNVAAHAANYSAYWKLDETVQGSTVIDSSTNANNGTVSGSPMPSLDHPNLLNIIPDTESLSFNPETSDRVDVGEGSSIQLSGSFSMAFWMKPTSWNDNTSQGVISNYDTNHGYIVYDDSSDSCDGSCGNLLNFRVFGASHEYDYLHSTASVENGVWQHWAITYNAGARLLKIYKNGVLDTTYSNISIGNATAYSIASLGFSQPWNGYFKGNLDDFRIYQNALSGSDVAYLAATGEPAHTEVPTLFDPISSYTYGDTNPLTVRFSLPQDMHADSLHLVFAPVGIGASIDILLRDAQSGRTNSFTLTPADLTGVNEIISSNQGSIPDGTYNVLLTYQNANQDPAATASSTNVTIAASSSVPVLATVTPVASSTTATAASYVFTNTESAGTYEFEQVTQNVDGSVAVHLDQTTHTVTFTGLQVGGTYSTAFRFIDADHHVSNTLHIGPFTVVAPPSSGGGGGREILNVPAPTPIKVTSTASTATSTPAAVPSLPQVPVQDQSKSICSPYITTFIQFGDKNNADDVKRLQTFLNSYSGESLQIDGIYKKADVEAVKRFQTKNKAILAFWGIKTATGYVYTATQKAINQIQCQHEVDLGSLAGNATSTLPLFTKTLRLGMSDPQVRQLQQFLNAFGFPIATSGNGSRGHEVTTFGVKTAQALKLFQKSIGLPADGVFGPATRKWVNAHR